MPIDPEPSDQTKAALREVVARLQRRMLEEPLVGSDLILGCREILNAWVRGGGSSLHDAVIGFTSIESQTDYVLGGSQADVGRPVDRVRFELGSRAETPEVQKLSHFFRGEFMRDLEQLALFLDGS